MHVVTEIQTDLYTVTQPLVRELGFEASSVWLQCPYWLVIQCHMFSLQYMGPNPSYPVLMEDVTPKGCCSFKLIGPNHVKSKFGLASLPWEFLQIRGVGSNLWGKRVSGSGCNLMNILIDGWVSHSRRHQLTSPSDLCFARCTSPWHCVWCTHSARAVAFYPSPYAQFLKKMKKDVEKAKYKT